MKSRTKNIDKELAALSGMREEDIDTSDIPEVKDWSGARLMVKILLTKKKENGRQPTAQSREDKAT